MDLLENENIYQQTKDAPTVLEVSDTVPTTELETPKATRGVPLWLAVVCVLSAVAGSTFIWHMLNKDAVFPAETTVDTNQRLAAATNNAVEPNADSDSEVEPTEPSEIINLGGEAELNVDLLESSNRLEDAVFSLTEDLECGFFNYYYKIAWEATEQGIDPLFALQPEMNDLTYAINESAGIPDMGQRIENQLVVSMRLSALTAVISVANGDTRNETAPLCTYATGETAQAADTYLKRLNQVLEEKRAGGLR